MLNLVSTNDIKRKKVKIKFNENESTLVRSQTYLFRNHSLSVEEL